MELARRSLRLRLLREAKVLVDPSQMSLGPPVKTTLCIMAVEDCRDWTGGHVI